MSSGARPGANGNRQAFRPGYHAVFMSCAIDGICAANPWVALFFVAGGFFFFCWFVVPGVVAQSELTWQGLGLANTDLTAFVQKFLDQSVIGCFFWNMFHVGKPNLFEVQMSL